MLMWHDPWPQEEATATPIPTDPRRQPPTQQQEATTDEIEEGEITTTHPLEQPLEQDDNKANTSPGDAPTNNNPIEAPTANGTERPLPPIKIKEEETPTTAGAGPTEKATAEAPTEDLKITEELDTCPPPEDMSIDAPITFNLPPPLPATPLIPWTYATCQPPYHDSWATTTCVPKVHHYYYY